MKLVMVTTYTTPTNVRRQLLADVRARGHAVTVVSPTPAAMMEQPLAALGVGYKEWPVQRTGIDPVADARSALDLLRILRAEHADVVLAYQIKAVLITPIVARVARVKRVVVLVNGLGAVFDERGFGASATARLARRAYQVALRFAHEVVFQNSDDPAFLAKAGLISARTRQRVVRGSGIDLTQFRATPAHGSPPTFTLISRMLVSKGVRDFIVAAQVIRARHPTARFVLIGPLEAEGHPDGVTRAEIDRAVADIGVEYFGFTDDVRGYLARSTAFVLPSYYREGVPRTNLEALAMGRPVVTTDSVGCRDTVEDGINGYLVPPRDPQRLVEALERYVLDPDLAVRHGHASRAMAERDFDIRVVNAAMLAALGLA